MRRSMTSPESPSDPHAVDSTTRLVLARLASGASRLAGEPPRAEAPGNLRVRFRMPHAAGGGPTRLEAGALAAALVAATVVGAAMPGSKDARAQTAVPTTVAAVSAAPAPAT